MWIVWLWINWTVWFGGNLCLKFKFYSNHIKMKKTHSSKLQKLSQGTFPHLTIVRPKTFFFLKHINTHNRTLCKTFSIHFCVFWFEKCFTFSFAWTLFPQCSFLMFLLVFSSFFILIMAKSIAALTDLFNVESFVLWHKIIGLVLGEIGKIVINEC